MVPFRPRSSTGLHRSIPRGGERATPEIHIEIEGLEKILDAAKAFPKEVDLTLSTVMRQAQRHGRRWAIEKAPVRSGFLRSRIYTAPLGRFGFWLISGAPYSAPVEWGSRPHEIRAVRAKALRFVIGGVTIFRKRVWHPGTRPQPFMMPTARRLLGWIRSELIRRLSSTLQRGFRR